MRKVLSILKIIQFWYRRRTQYNNTGKIALCCIGKMENEYIREYVTYYKDLGIDHIFIYDNNDEDGEFFEAIIGDYVEIGLCEIINYRGRKLCQLEAYQDCYKKNNKKYDWIAFFDCDEFLTLLNGVENIHNFLEDKKFLPYQLIHINWMVYGDNELLDNDGRPVVERLKEPIKPYNYEYNNIPINNHIKTIIRGGLSDINWLKSVGASHTPLSRYYACCNAKGEEVEANSPFAQYDYSCAYIRHYTTKTIGEWIRNKMVKGFPDQSEKRIKDNLTLNNFFIWNKKTTLKIDYAHMLIETIKHHEH